MFSMFPPLFISKASCSSSEDEAVRSMETSQGLQALNVLRQNCA